MCHPSVLAGGTLPAGADRVVDHAPPGAGRLPVKSADKAENRRGIKQKLPDAMHRLAPGRLRL